MKHTLFIFSCLLVFGASAEKQPFERYQSILDKQMFGPLPPGFDPTKLPNEVQKSSVTEKELTQEQQKLQSAIHFSVINVDTDGQPMVGFTDNSDPKVPRHYFLKVGESRDGWTVKEADAETATMKIAKNDIEVSLTLGGNSAQGAGTTARANAGMAGGALRPATGVPQGFGNRPGGLFAGGSLRARRLQRQQEEADQKAKAEAAAAEKEAERQAQAEQEKAQREAQAEQEKAQREAERAEQRQQLLAIKEELERVRAASKTDTDEEKKGQNSDADNGAF